MRLLINSRPKLSGKDPMKGDCKTKFVGGDIN